MAYEYKLTISAIAVNANDLITDLVVAVKDGSNADVDFAALTFTVKDAATNADIDFTTDNATKKITFTTPQANTVAALVSAINTTTPANNTNLLLVDFNQAFDANGQATIAYKVPSESGNYTLTFKSVDGTSIPQLTKSLNINNNADAAYSSITYQKAYLSKRVSTTINVVATLHDSSDVAVTGTDEVDLSAQS